MNNTLLTITGPSLSGKSTLEAMLSKNYSTNRLISFTTRQPRDGEIDGKHYHFLDMYQASGKIQSGEAAEYTRFNDNFYGLLGSELQLKLKTGSCVAVVEPNGVKQLRKYCQENAIRHRAIFLTNPPEVLAARFLQRFRNDSKASPIDYATRMVSVMKHEQDWIHAFNYDGVYIRFDSSNETNLVKEVYFKFLDEPKLGGWND